MATVVLESNVYGVPFSLSERWALQQAEAERARQAERAYLQSVAAGPTVMVRVAVTENVVPENVMYSQPAASRPVAADGGRR